jgi:mannitol-1-phosphate 5-dehydrogenase
MSEAVVIGAGCIGRGFVAKLFSDAGWHVTFLDILAPLVEALARDGSYVHMTVDKGQAVRTVVGPVSAIDNGRDPGGAVAALVSADVAATAVGGARLAEIAPLIATAVAQRITVGRPPLNLLLCENLHGAASVMRGLLIEQAGVSAADIDAQLGLLETSIDRTIPVVGAEMQAVDRSIMVADPYRPLLYDIAAVRGPVLDVPGIAGDPSVPFAFYGERKLYVHNMGHAMTAYLGERAGADLVCDAIAIPEVHGLVRGAMAESSTALAAAYSQPLQPLVDLVDDLLDRFADRALPDPVARVGRHPERKTAPGDRLLGPYASAVRQGLPSAHLSLAVAVGADALRRHCGWSRACVWRHFGPDLDDLTAAQRGLLDAQIDLLAQGADLTAHSTLIERYDIR